MLGLPFVPPEEFPMIALAPSRVYYWRLDQDEALAKGGFGSALCYRRRRAVLGRRPQRKARELTA